MERPHPEPEFEARFETTDEFIRTIQTHLLTDEKHASHIYNAITRGQENPMLCDAANAYLEVLDNAIVAMQFTHFSEQVFTGGRRLQPDEAYEIIVSKVLHCIYQDASNDVADETLSSITQLFVDFGERALQKNMSPYVSQAAIDRQVA